MWGVYDHYARSIFGAIDVEVPWQLLRVNHYVGNLSRGMRLDLLGEATDGKFL